MESKALQAGHVATVFEHHAEIGKCSLGIAHTIFIHPATEQESLIVGRICLNHLVECLKCLWLLALSKIDAGLCQKQRWVGGIDARCAGKHAKSLIVVFACAIVLNDASLENERRNIAWVFSQSLVDINQRWCELANFKLAACCIGVDGVVVVDVFADDLLEVAQCLAVVELTHGDGVAQIVERAYRWRIVD